MKNHFAAGILVAGCAAGAWGQVATFEQLRTPFYPFAGLTNESRMSGDGRTVTDGAWRWSRDSGYSPSGFIPGELSGSTMRRRPLGLSDDGTVEFGELRRDELFWPSVPLQGYYWQGGGQFTRFNTIFGNIVPWNLYGSPMSGDGRWLFFTRLQSGQAVRRDRNGREETLGVLSGSWAGPASKDGSVVLVQYKPGAIPASSNAADAAWMDFGAEAVVFGLSSNADYFFGYRSPATRLWSVWRRDGNECARLGPVGNDVWLTLRGISDDGLTAAGVSWSGGAQPVLTPIVWRAGELPRTLRSVFRRFGATQAAYYNLTDLLGVSTDGKTILGYATSPWFGSAAFIATIPEWSPCASDFDFDGVVSDEDFVIFAAAYDDLDTTACDLNTDNRTDDLDFVLFAGAYDVLVCP